MLPFLCVLCSNVRTERTEKHKSRDPWGSNLAVTPSHGLTFLSGSLAVVTALCAACYYQAGS